MSLKDNEQMCLLLIGAGKMGWLLTTLHTVLGCGIWSGVGSRRKSNYRPAARGLLALKLPSKPGGLVL